MLADVVGGMRFAREDDLNGAPGRVEDPRQPVGVVKDQLGPLVAGEPARETNRQRVRFEQCAGGDDTRNADVFFGPPMPRALADEGEQITVSATAGRPRARHRGSPGSRPTPTGRRGGRSSSARGTSPSRSASSAAIHVGTCTPLVTAVTGRLSAAICRPHRRPHRRASPGHAAG